MSIFILGIDPGLATCGVAKLRAFPDKDEGRMIGRVIYGHTFTTESTVKKLKVHASHDAIRRVQELARHLQPLIASSHLVCMEGVSMPRHASSAGKLCMSYGMIAALCHAESKPLIQYSPQEVAKWFPDGKGKEPRVKYCEEYYPDIMANLLVSLRDHTADAIALAYLAMRDPLFMAMAQRIEA